MANNASFGAADFDVLWDNPFTVPIPVAQDILVTRHVPYGNRTIVQNLGRESVDGQYVVEMTVAEYGVLLSLRGSAATLDIDGDEVRTGVILRSVTNVEKDATHDLVKATLTFMVR